jgi:hypothetical protein
VLAVTTEIEVFPGFLVDWSTFFFLIVKILRFFAGFPPFFVVFGALRFLKMVWVGTLGGSKTFGPTNKMS